MTAWLAAQVGASGPAADKVSPGVLGAVVTLGLALATVLLIRSMVGHLRKVRYGPGPDPEPGEQGPSERTPGEQGLSERGPGEQGPGEPAEPADRSEPGGLKA
jgi:hypothetical protein